MDALVKAALDKAVGSVNRIFELKESEYPSSKDLRIPEPHGFAFDETYDEARSEAISMAVRTVDALRSVLKILD